MEELLKKFLNHKHCIYCNYEYCICPSKRTMGSYVSSIKEEKVKGKKYVTNIYGSLEKATFISLKKILGTGGTFNNSIISLRGQIEKRVRKVLEDMNYRVIE